MKYKFKKGDISLLVTFLLCGILLTLLSALSQKISVEANISRKNLMSQQAIQAAKTGLDEFKYNLNNMSLNGFDINSSIVQKWPNGSTSNSDTINIIEESGEYWVKLDNDLGTQYRIEYIPSTDSSVDPKIISKARVKKNSLTIERAFEDNIKRIPDNCPGLNHSATRTQSCPSDTPIGAITEQCNDGTISVITNTCRAPICNSISATWVGDSGYVGGLSSTQEPDTDSNGNLIKPDPYNYCSNLKPRSDIYNSTCNNWSCSYTGQNNCSDGSAACYFCQCLSCSGTYEVCN